MLPTPIGFVRLLEAVDVVDQKMADREGAVRLIAEACERGQLKAAYRVDSGGVDDLDTRHWQMPQWRMFEIGMIELDLPLHEGNGRPHPQGFTAKCEREVFVRRDSLDRLVEDLPPAGREKMKGGRPPKYERAAVSAEVSRLMDYHGEFSPEDLEWNAQVRLIEAVRSKFGEASNSTIEGYIKDPLADWRSRRNPKT
jgi:hypothetical protein